MVQRLYEERSRLDTVELDILILVLLAQTVMQGYRSAKPSNTDFNTFGWKKIYC